MVTSVSLKNESLQYIAIYYDGSIFNETDVCSAFKVRIKTRQIAIAVSGMTVGSTPGRHMHAK